jgi:hypothetical protein
MDREILDDNILKVCAEGALAQAVSVCAERSDMTDADSIARKIWKSAQAQATKLLQSATERLSAGVDAPTNAGRVEQSAQLGIAYLLVDALELVDVYDVVDIATQTNAWLFEKSPSNRQN